MSYTPDEEKLSEPLNKACNALEALANPIRARLKNPDNYKASHLVELAELLKDITKMEVRLMLMATQVR